MILVEIFPDLAHESFVIWCKNHSDRLNENEDIARTFFNEYIIYSHVSITKISNIKRDILTTLSFWDIKMHIENAMNGKYPDDRNCWKKFKFVQYFIHWNRVDTCTEYSFLEVGLVTYVWWETDLATNNTSSESLAQML